MRALVGERDAHCRWCGSSRANHVHHILYRSQGGPHTPENLILLCLHCHELVHGNKRKYQPILLEIVQRPANVLGKNVLRMMEKLLENEGPLEE